jgi:hypothetical protein
MLPDGVERLLDLLHQRDDRVEQQRESTAPSTDVHPLDEADDAVVISAPSA